MEKIYLVIKESNVDGEILFNVVPCISFETAKVVVEIEKEIILNESHRYKNYKDHPEEYQFEEDDESVFIKTLCDDYYENIYIQEKEIQY